MYSIVSSSRRCFSSFGTPPNGVMSPTNDSAMSCTNAIFTHLSRLMVFSGNAMQMMDMRYMWSRILSVLAMGTPRSTHPVSGWVFKRRTIWRNASMSETGFLRAKRAAMRSGSASWGFQRVSVMLMVNSGTAGRKSIEDQEMSLSNQLNNSTGSSDLLLSQLGNKSGLDNDRNVWQLALTQNLAVTEGQGVDDWGSRGRGRLEVLVSLLLLNQRPQLVQVDLWAPEVVSLLVEVSHTDLTEVTRVVLVQVGSVVVLTTSLTTTTGVLSVLADSTLTGGDVTSVLSGFG